MVAAIFPDADTSAIEAYRSLWDPLSPKLGAHITVVFPSDTLEPSEDLHTQMRHAVAGFPAFPVHAPQASTWDDEYVFLVLKRGADEVRELHRTLYAGPFRHALAPDPYLPHMTIGRTSPERLPTALADAQGLRLEGLARMVTVYSVENDGSRNELFTVNLKGDR